MAQHKPAPYRFDDLPLNDLEAGTNLLVSGPTDTVREFVTEALQPIGDGQASVVVATELAAEAVRARVGGHTDTTADGAALGVVDATGDVSPDGTSGTDRIRTADPHDLSGVGMQFSALYDEVQRDGWGRVRAGVVSLPALFATAESAKPVFRLLHNTTSRVRRGNGIGFYTRSRRNTTA